MRLANIDEKMSEKMVMVYDQLEELKSREPGTVTEEEVKKVLELLDTELSGESSPAASSGINTGKNGTKESALSSSSAFRGGEKNGISRLDSARKEQQEALRSGDLARGRYCIVSNFLRMMISFIIFLFQLRVYLSYNSC
jgi:hypothetical protein